VNRQQRRAAAKQGHRNLDARPVTNSAGVSDLFAAAVRHHQAGRLAEAEADYRKVLATDSDHADALGMLGILACQVGRRDVATALLREAVQKSGTNPAHYCNLSRVLRDDGKLEEAIGAARQAIAIKPDLAVAHFSLGSCLHDNGQIDEAVASYREAILLKPDMADSHSNLGNALRRLGRLDEAVAACRQATRLKPDFADAHCNLGTALFDQGNHAEAAQAFERAIHLKPDLAEAHYSLGCAIHKEGNLDAAIAATRRAIQIRPEYVEAISNLGSMLQDAGELDGAVSAYREAILLKPRYVEARINLGAAFFAQGKLDQAISEYREVIELKPHHGEALSNIGRLLRQQGRLDDAASACRQAIAVQPNIAMAYSNLAAVLSDQGRFDEAMDVCGNAVRHKIEFARAYSSFLFHLNNSDRISPETLFEAHRAWDEWFGPPTPQPAAHANESSLGKRLKVGYVSPDFCEHSIVYFLEPLMRNLDRGKIEIFCYSDVMVPDASTEKLRQLADHWVASVGMSDDALVERIRNDRIDILIDLAGHTRKNRLAVFARKPAPVQATWLGYPNTTGLKAIQYRLVDALTDPVGQGDPLASETLLRLPGGFLCYAPPCDAPAPAPAPCLATGTVTFGSFNNPAKLSESTLEVWARVLTRLPHARLLLKARAFADTTTRASYVDRLTRLGVAPTRITLLDVLPTRAHLGIYASAIDIALDPFPYNGATTTCEALWMGVPVVTLRGDRHAGRVGASLLTQIGLSELSADSREAYIDTAVALASDPARLSELRLSLRPRMAASPLCDAPAFGRKMEHAYRTMWQRWCATRDAGRLQPTVQP
jgi:protein O-GlcNAc transferase